MAVNTTQQDSPLLSLPAEIRNQIYDLALVEEDKDVDVAVRWPGITGTCKQIRSDTLPVYLANNTFTAHIADLEDKSLRSWLDIIDGLTTDHKSLVKSLTIKASGKLLIRGKFSLASLASDCPLPEFGFWNALILRLKRSGLQVVWSGANPKLQVEDLSQDPYALERNIMQAAERYHLNAFVLLPLAKRHDMMGDDKAKRPSLDVTADVTLEDGSGMQFQSAEETRFVARARAKGDPKEWYERWAAEEEGCTEKKQG